MHGTVSLLLITLLNLEPLRHHEVWISLQTFLVDRLLILKGRVRSARAWHSLWKLDSHYVAPLVDWTVVSRQSLLCHHLALLVLFLRWALELRRLLVSPSWAGYSRVCLNGRRHLVL